VAKVALTVGRDVRSRPVVSGDFARVYVALDLSLRFSLDDVEVICCLEIHPEL